ncbi:hypothetical protein BL250_05875 [Erwinia sp. OLTSP20]|nr:hypothetical protein BV501_05335 [Erwinia sp. OAMSP11]PIJ73943.1 hypothetical protein BK416_05610 [Erwinia sp. OLSSP12]PIJ83951.1 hypothetical protein BLD47_03235 [Erwinia sp. OLCASP19]PIJ86481.1 hypothetical protein BLD46_03515 [Erwinia sp. OLMTSP26]PIJ87960.1 hypothetical protein BLD49_04195 [Erwinia sp. OLMDSP33]PIJ90578.1 hypothetical protein BL249_12305 [Erwinia sp. OLFS4]PIJ93576.1 hypothetical protein BL250_05875 [Erwinia sp. OLTSP20]
MPFIVRKQSNNRHFYCPDNINANSAAPPEKQVRCAKNPPTFTFQPPLNMHAPYSPARQSARVD